MFVSGGKGVVRAALEKRKDRVDQEKYDENVVNVETCCPLLVLLILSLLPMDIIGIIELKSTLSHTYPLKGI